MDLSQALEPNRPPKTDKATILSDAVRILTGLRSEAQQLRESNHQLREAIKDLKVDLVAFRLQRQVISLRYFAQSISLCTCHPQTEKNELRDEKLRLKADKERLEQQVKSMTSPGGFMPHPAAIHAAAAAFAAQTQAASTKAAQMAGYAGLPMWQWMPPAAVDTSQDHMLRPPVA